MPEIISAISWGYNSQFVLAYSFYTKNGWFPVFGKNNDNDWEKLSDYGCIFKVNGPATYDSFTLVNEILKDNNLPKYIYLIMFYGYSETNTSSMGFLFAPYLSFA